MIIFKKIINKILNILMDFTYLHLLFFFKILVAMYYQSNAYNLKLKKKKKCVQQICLCGANEVKIEKLSFWDEMFLVDPTTIFIKIFSSSPFLLHI